MNYKALKIATLVDSKNQMKDSPSVRFENLSNEGLRVLFVGNSVTLHGPSEPIGWFGDWGMAASGKEKDYVHLVEDHIKTKYPNASFCICNAADWERGYKNSEETGKIALNEKAKTVRVNKAEFASLARKFFGARASAVSKQTEQPAIESLNPVVSDKIKEENGPSGNGLAG